MKTVAIEAVIDMLSEVLGSKYLLVITDAKEELAAIKNEAQQITMDGHCTCAKNPIIKPVDGICPVCNGTSKG